jgi:hypothetical protein
VVTAALSASGAFQVTSAVPWWRNAPRNAEVRETKGTDCADQMVVFHGDSSIKHQET